MLTQGLSLQFLLVDQSKGSKNGEMVPIGTMPKNRDRLVSTGN